MQVQNRLLYALDFSCYDSHGHQFLRYDTPRKVLAQLFLYNQCISDYFEISNPDSFSFCLRYLLSTLGQCTVLRQVSMAYCGFIGIGHADYSLQCGLSPH